MGPLQPEPQSDKREHPLIAIGVVLALLLTALLALPFLARTRHHPTHRTVSATTTVPVRGPTHPAPTASRHF